MIDNSGMARDWLKQTGLQTILDLEGITEVAVNEPLRVWFDRGNGWETQDMPNLTLQSCLALAKSLCVFAGLTKPIGIENPLASVILPDGERGQIAVPPATLQGHISMTFRKPSLARFSLEDYEKTGRFSRCKEIIAQDDALTDQQTALLEFKKKGDYLTFLREAVKMNMNILLVGGTGSGKTTFMKALVDCYPLEKRLFTIEDVHELGLPLHANHVHLLYKQGGLTPKQLIEACMRMKPDHVLLAELRGDEAWGYIEMLNTGHQGSITTIHANDCLSAPARLATLIKQSEVGRTLDHELIMRTITSSIDVIAFFNGTYLTELMYEPQRKNAILAGKS
ncbi:P-type DNA transfer ATPase VirB11 [Vibrio sinensis]|nr:P-type DNA transfer ATPase VirB11 [Vibrio sinensis]